jgi:hypothetical protein
MHTQRSAKPCNGTMIGPSSSSPKLWWSQSYTTDVLGRGLGAACLRQGACRPRLTGASSRRLFKARTPAFQLIQRRTSMYALHVSRACVRRSQQGVPCNVYGLLRLLEEGWGSLLRGELRSVAPLASFAGGTHVLAHGETWDSASPLATPDVLCMEPCKASGCVRAGAAKDFSPLSRLLVVP